PFDLTSDTSVIYFPPAVVVVVVELMGVSTGCVTGVSCPVLAFTCFGCVTVTKPINMQPRITATQAQTATFSSIPLSSFKNSLIGSALMVSSNLAGYSS